MFESVWQSWRTSVWTHDVLWHARGWCQCVLRMFFAVVNKRTAAVKALLEGGSSSSPSSSPPPPPPSSSSSPPPSPPPNNQTTSRSIDQSINQSVNKKWINGSKMNQQQSMWSDIIHYEAVSSNTKFHFSSNIHTNTMISISIWNITWATCYLKYIQTPNYRIECIFLYLNTVST